MLQRKYDADMSRRPTAAMRGVIGALRLRVVLPFTSASVDIGFNPPDFRVGCDILPAQRPASGLYGTKAVDICFIANIYCGVGQRI